MLVAGTPTLVQSPSCLLGSVLSDEKTRWYSGWFRYRVLTHPSLLVTALVPPGRPATRIEKVARWDGLKVVELIHWHDTHLTIASTRTARSTRQGSAVHYVDMYYSYISALVLFIVDAVQATRW